MEVQCEDLYSSNAKLTGLGSLYDGEALMNDCT